VTSRESAPSVRQDSRVSPGKPPREARGSRRRKETHAKLLDAAFKLMADNGVDGVAVNDITEAADVGFGSFYNHFPSKEAIHAELIDMVFGEFADTLDRSLRNVEDPAEIIAASVRHTLNRARSDRTWARFLLREGLSVGMLTRGLGTRLLRDIRAGMDAGRFAGDDELVALLAIAGTALAAIATEVQYHGGAALEPAMRNRVGLPSPELPERVAAAVLRFLGVPAVEARRIARRPLAALDSARVSAA
jgi:AcrR family transcriptional regulator